MTTTRPDDARSALQELARIALSEQSMESVLQTVADLAKRTIPGVDEASVSLVREGLQATVVTTAALATELDEAQYAVNRGPCVDAAFGGEVREITDMRAEERWPEFAASAVERGVLSAMAVPVPVQQQVLAALNLYAHQSDAFDEESCRLAVEFASYAGVAIANMHLYMSSTQLATQLQEAMQSRAVIDQAKGILMGQRRIPAAEAFDLLVALSQASNRKLRDVAQALVDDAAKPG